MKTKQSRTKQCISPGLIFPGESSVLNTRTQWFDFAVLPFRAHLAAFANFPSLFSSVVQNADYFLSGTCLPIWKRREAPRSNLLTLCGEGVQARGRHPQKHECVRTSTSAAAAAQSGCPVPGWPRAHEITYKVTHALFII